MKKIIVALCFLSIATIGFSIPNFGVKAGVNFLSLSDMKEMKTQPGFDIGLFARLKFQKLYLQPEVLYSFQSAKYDNSDIKFKTNNLQIPVLLGYKLLDMKLMNLRVFIGPEFGFVLGDDNKPADRSLNSANIMGDIGVGIDIAMLTLDFKYGYAFNKTFDDGNVHNNLFSLSLGWKIL